MAEEISYKRLQRVVFTAAFVFAAIWFAWEIINILLLFFLAIVMALILNAPTMWLVSKKLPRTLAALIVFFAMLVFFFLIGWLVVPKMVEQVNSLLVNLPDYLQSLSSRLSAAFDGYPSIQEKLKPEKLTGEGLPSAAVLMGRIGRISLSVLGTLVLLILFFSIVAYMLIDPGPLVQTYLEFFSAGKRVKAANALAHSSTMLIGWMWSNLIVGIIEAVSVFIFLSWMGVPGVWLWAGLTLFAELIPKIGFYLMSVPPTLIALSIDPSKALWVMVFYIAMDELMGDFVMPKVRATTMKIHPVFTLFVMLATTSAFGLLGTFIATPLAAFIKAYYSEFHPSRVHDSKLDKNVNAVLERKIQ